MKKEAVVFAAVFVSAILLFSLVSASSVDDEIKKITYYAEEYETGNIDYVMLLLYSSSVRENLNEIMGAVGKDYGGLLKEEKIKEVLGSPTEDTKWVWVENEEREKKLDNPVPVWNKIIFDGRKIQIKLNAYPSIFKKKSITEEEKYIDDLIDFQDKVIYRLNFETQFKKPGDEKLDVEKRIEEVKLLAENFNSNPSGENAEALARESVNVERSFETYFRQEGGKCEDIMSGIFGAENQRDAQKLLVQEITFYEWDNFEAIARLETCEECEWCWVNLDIRMEGRGFGLKMSEGDTGPDIQESYENNDDTYFRAEIKGIFDEIKRLMEKGDFSSALALKSKIWELNEAWNKQGNDVWRDVEEIFNKKREAMSEAEMQKFNEDYGWIKEEQERRQMVKELQDMHCEKIKSFYSELFSGYYQKEFYFTQIEFKERLVQEFMEFGEEICDNNKDDNENGEIDCAEEQCGGEICGWEEIEIKQEINEEIVEELINESIGEAGEEILEVVNSLVGEEEVVESEQSVIEEIITSETSPLTGDVIEESIKEESEVFEEELPVLTERVPLYCINKVCQLKKERVEERKFVCGNHICESGEDLGNCIEDCSTCQEHDPIECSGKVIFKGKDENGCPLEPICIEESCEKDEDCEFLCGEGECIEGKCGVKELKECREKQCAEGEKQIITCSSGEKIVTAICGDGLWMNLNIACSPDSITGENKEDCQDYCRSVEETSYFECPGHMEISGTYPECNCDWPCEELVGEECTTRLNCGGENDVCSNGQCVEIPQAVKISEPVQESLTEQEADTEETEVSTVAEEESESTEPETNELSHESVTEESSQEQTPEPVQEIETPLTGEIIFGFFQTLFSRTSITNLAITGFQTEDSVPEENPGQESPPQTQEQSSEEEIVQIIETEEISENNEESPQENENPSEETQEFNEQPGEYQREENARAEQEQQERIYREEKDTKEMEKREQEQRENCKKECIRPCIEKCTRDNCGENMDCSVNEEIKKCEEECFPEESCIEKCMQGGDWWKEFQNEDEYKEEKGVFEVGGSCRTSQGKTEAFIWFGGWGDPFEKIQPLKQKYYSREGDWCKEDLENLVMQREEFEKGFSEEFVKWFFEQYLANSAEDWEQAASGIFEIYWRDVDMSRQMAERIGCLGGELDENSINLINVKYETEYGSLEFWEEIKTVNLGMSGMENIEEGNEGSPQKISGEKVKIISPYMKIWIFPTKEFLMYEMKESMKNHEFPGSPEEKMERKNEDGLTAEEKDKIRENKGFMEKIKKISEKYGGSLDIAVQLKDQESGEIVFNLYAQVNEDEILNIEPMLPEEISGEDIKVEINFEEVYDLIYEQEKEIGGAQIESPPWDRKSRPVQKIKEVVNGIKMFFKVRSIVNSAKITPEESRGDVKSLFNSFLKMMIEKGGDMGADMEKEGENFAEEKDIWESKEKITGEVII